MAVYRSRPFPWSPHGAMTNAQIDVISAESMDYVRAMFALWQEQAAAANLPTKFYLIEVSFQQPEDETERAYLNGLPHPSVCQARMSISFAKPAVACSAPIRNLKGLLQDFPTENSIKRPSGYWQRNPNWVNTRVSWQPCPN